MFNFRSIQFIITVSFTLVTVIVVLIFSFLLYNKFAHTAEDNAALNIEQIVSQVNYNLENYADSTMSIVQVIQDGVTGAGDIADNKLKQQLQSVLGTREDLVSAAVFTLKGQMELGIPAQPMLNNSRLTQQSWFESALAQPGKMLFSPPHIQNLFKGQYKWVVSISRQIEYVSHGVKQKGILLVDVNFRTIDDLSKRVSLGKRGYVYILDPQGNLVYHPQQQLIYAGLKYENIEPVLGYAYGSYTDYSTGEARLITVKTVNPIGWKTVGVAYKDEMVTTKRDLSHFVIWSLVIASLFVVILSFIVSAAITRPIRRLEKSVSRVELGYLDTPIDVKGAYEVERLSGRFNDMLQHIRQLMDQIIEEQEAKRKGELDVLQAQINPHFLYNTLNSVIRLAERGMNEEVITAITSLSKFFRISLSKGKNIISLEEELEHVRHYLIIQKIRYKDRFDYEIQADDEIRDCLTLKLILQPIVENAIVHGIEPMADRGFILIRASLQNGLIVLRIADNGLGMSESTLARMLTGQMQSDHGSGVGVNNVHERIRLYFGEGYGLDFESELEEGTTVTITFPAVREHLGEGKPR
ncbi:sensor histidine kinase [Paenibacillus sp. JX-17]|uniref:histidine kinase n=1 Tax=Paenibacillus lacisoli TaxID=3064525 RepID=A0ABT9C6X1_9BACL|nr:sensor histidine kinase [Paenibacillus sp. JX-17]MDO7904998.1 sensor histidine kinase [Paenibacillus sp. JX-17]